MNTISLLTVAFASLIFGVAAWISLRKSQQNIIKHSQILEQREKELRRHIFELQILRSLSEKTGYDFNIQPILEVIIQNSVGLLDFSAVAYVYIKDGKICFKIHAQEALTHLFLNQTKDKILSDFTKTAHLDLTQINILDHISGVSCDDAQLTNMQSYLGLPLKIGDQVLAMIAFSSTKKDQYPEEEQLIVSTIFNNICAQASKIAQTIDNEKRRLLAVISSSPDGIMLVDSKLNLIVVNPLLPKLLSLLDGITRVDEVIKAVGPAANLKDAIEEAFTGQRLVTIPSFNLMDKQLQISVEPLFDKDKFGYFLGVAVIFHDLAAVKQIERLREEFTAMMIHELRTPLTTIAYSTDMMLSDFERLSKEDLMQHLNIIKSTVGSMLSLVSELLDIAKIEAGKFIVVKEEGDLNKLLEEQMTVFKPLADQKHLKLTLVSDPTVGFVSYDRNRLCEVLNNLLSNAIKYTDSGGIIIKTKKQDHMVQISVSDSGEGIKKEDMLKLFSKFEQLGKGKTGDKKGTGLGLVIAKGIIEAHGGRIWAQSDGAGKGSTFTFSLPLTLDTKLSAA